MQSKESKEKVEKWFIEARSIYAFIHWEDAIKDSCSDFQSSPLRLFKVKSNEVTQTVVCSASKLKLKKVG